MKYEYVHRFRKSNDVFDDALITKRIFDSTCIYVSKNPLRGFIHELGLDPFGFLLLSDLQVKNK